MFLTPTNAPNGRGNYRDYSSANEGVFTDYDHHWLSNVRRNPTTLVEGHQWRAPSAYTRAISVSTREGPYRAMNLNNGSIYEGQLYGFTNGANSSCLRPYFDHESFAWDSNAIVQTETECMLKLSEKKADMGTAIGESRQALTMLARSSVALWESYRAVRRGDLAKAARLLGVDPKKGSALTGPASAWLSFRYGWAPLLNDLNDQFNILSSKIQEKGMLIHATRVKRFEGVEHRNYSDASTIHDIEWKSLYKTRLDAIVDVPGLREASRLGLTNPLGVAWELVPYSFIVDWFAPIGSMLELSSARAGLRFIGGSTSLCAIGSHVVFLKPYSGVAVLSTGKLSVRKYHFERYPLGDFPIGRLYLRDNPLKSKQSLDALALWHQTQKDLVSTPRLYTRRKR